MTAPSGIPVRLRSRGEPTAAYETACAAPAIQLRFDPNGLVTTCCKSLQPLGHIGHERLLDIWQGAHRRAVVEALEVGDFSAGCQRCGEEIAREGRAVSYAAIHDAWAGHLTADPATRAWPVRMEMNLSNACNLMCIQCDGDSSSAIRLHREGRPPLPQVYDDRFFEDLRAFLPHLERIVFAGGEPFLGRENFRVWDLIAEEAPHIDCQVVTNATQWTPRIEALLERIRFSFVFSLDGIHRETYEAIRVGADLAEVLANVDRFCAYAAERGTTVAVNHCLMPQNVLEFGDLLVWADARDLQVNVSVVRTPARSSLAALPAAELLAVHEALEAQDPTVRPRLRRNLGTWDAERHRVAAWAASVADGGEASASSTVLFFPAQGGGPHDERSARAELAAWAADGRVQAIGVRADDTVAWSEVDLDGPVELAGQHFQELTKALVAAYGNLTDYEVERTGTDEVHARARFGTTPARIATVARRDASGWADQACVLVAFRPEA